MKCQRNLILMLAQMMSVKMTIRDRRTSILILFFLNMLVFSVSHTPILILFCSFVCLFLEYLVIMSYLE